MSALLNSKLFFVLLATGIVVAVVATAFLGHKGAGGPQKDSSVSAGEGNIFHDDQALREYVKTNGTAKTIQRLGALSATLGSCHDPAHKAGRFSYELYGADAFRECSAECQSGCYHGAIEAYFKEHGTADLKGNLNKLCDPTLNIFFYHQCVHGIGHGLMAWTNYDLPDALKACDVLNSHQDSCYSGVFMENIVGGLADSAISGHFTRYLNDDPQYPCNTMDKKYVWSCYFYQSTRMAQLSNYDFKKVAEGCLAAPNPNAYPCFESMGRDVGGRFFTDIPPMIQACQNAPKGIYRTACLTGAAQNTFWDPTGASTALAFCKTLSDLQEKDACDNTVIARATQLFATREQWAQFCSGIDAAHQALCENSTARANLLVR